MLATTNLVYVNEALEDVVPRVGTPVGAIAVGGVGVAQAVRFQHY